MKLTVASKKPERLMVCLDFSQIEMRVGAIIFREPTMARVLNDPDGDIHTETATGLNVPRDPIAKQCNFLLIFGGGARALKAGLFLAGSDQSLDYCENAVSGFDSHYPRMKEGRQELLAFHEVNGYVPSLCGCRRVIPNVGSSDRYLAHKAETQLANNVVQKSAQELIKMAMVRIDPERPNFDKHFVDSVNGLTPTHRNILKEYVVKVENLRKIMRKSDGKIHMQVHDELPMSCHAGAALDVAHAVAEVMTFRPWFQPKYPMSVRIMADGGVGPDWGSAKKPTDKSLKVHSPVAKLVY